MEAARSQGISSPSHLLSEAMQEGPIFAALLSEEAVSGAAGAASSAVGAVPPPPESVWHCVIYRLERRHHGTPIVCLSFFLDNYTLVFDTIQE